MKKFTFALFVGALLLYLISSNFIYSMDYETKEMQQQTLDKKQKINDLVIKKNTTFSKEEARKDKDLISDNNVYYLK